MLATQDGVGLGPGHGRESLAGGACCQLTIQLASPSFSRGGAPGLWAGARAAAGLQLGVGRGAASERGQE